jgi:hypothetical protein
MKLTSAGIKKTFAYLIRLDLAKKMRLFDFDEIWKRCVPKYKTELDMLDGLAYVEDQFIYYLNLFDLPDEVETR